MSEKGDETNAANTGDSTNEDKTSNSSEKENLKLLKLRLSAVKGRITRALNIIEPAIEDSAGYKDQGLWIG